MNFLERLAAAFMGATFLPVRSAYHSIEFAIAALVAGLGLIVGAPMLSSVLFNRADYSIAKNLTYTLFGVFPLTVVVVFSSLVACSGYLLVTTAVNIAKYSHRGFMSGLNDGFDGFWQTYTGQRSYLQAMIFRLDELILQLREERAYNEADFNILELINTQPAPHVESNFSELQSAMPSQNVKPLDEAELTRAKKMLNAYAALSVTIAPKIKEMIQTVQILIERHHTLSTDLEHVRIALSGQGRLDTLEDQLIPYSEVKTPIFLAKHYLATNNEWNSVPANGYISDKDALLNWLKNKPIHPLNRDNLRVPPKYLDRPTRYVWHLLTKDNCSVQELEESAQEIRQLTNLLDKELLKFKLQKVRANRSFQSIFFKKRPQEDAPECDAVSEALPAKP